MKVVVLGRLAAGWQRKKHRTATAVGAVILLLASAGASEPAAAALGCQPVTGTSYNAYGLPQPAVSVRITTESSCPTTASTTDGAGSYALESPTTSTYIPILAEHPHLVDMATSVSWLPTSERDFSMRWRLEAQLARRYVQPSQTVQLTALTTAPATAPAGRAPVIVVREDASAVVESLTYVGQSGAWTEWTDTWVAPTAPGRYPLSVCAVTSGDCSSQSYADAGLPAGQELGVKAGVEPLELVVDGADPVAISLSPQPLETTDAAAAAVVVWDGTGSPVDPTSVVLAIDGETRPVAVTTDGSQATVSTSLSSVGPGVHRVDYSAADMAGNETSGWLIYAKPDLTTTAALARLQRHAQQVNPSGETVGPRQMVISGADIVVDAYTAEWAATTRVGSGALERTFDLEEVEVRFERQIADAAGRRSSAVVQHPIPVIVGVAPSTRADAIATLAPAPGPTRARISSVTTTLPDFTVDVPLGFESQDSWAVVTPKTAPLGSVAASTHFATPHVGEVSVTVSVSSCLERYLDPPAELRCHLGSDPYAAAKVAGEVVKVPVPIPLSGPVDTTPSKTYSPSCSVGCTNPWSGSSGPASVFSGHAAIRLGCATTNVVGLGGPIPVNLCGGNSSSTSDDGYLAGYQNGWVYASEDTSEEEPIWHFPTWQQNRTVAGRDDCPNGESGEVVARITAATTRAQSLDPAAGIIQGGTYRLEGAPAADISSRVGQVTAHRSPEATTPTSGLPYQLGLNTLFRPRTLGVGAYSVAESLTTSEALNRWESTPTADLTIHLISGTDITTSDLLTGFAIQAGLEISAIVDFTACT